MTTLIHSEPINETPLSDTEAAALVAATSWYHRFQLRPGLVTPGGSEMAAAVACNSLGVPQDLCGKTALDVGAWDGPITFELERRGAKAAALDIQDPARVGFATARRVLGSRADHFQGSVYQLPSEKLNNLDVIIFRGVYYHLKYPLLAFERLAAALKIGGTLHFEGEGFIYYAETLAGQPVNAAHVIQTARSDIPVCLSYPNKYKGASNWFVPNAACLRGWMEVCGLEVREMKTYIDKQGGQRLYGWARKIADAVALEHPLY